MRPRPGFDPRWISPLLATALALTLALTGCGSGGAAAPRRGRAPSGRAAGPPAGVPAALLAEARPIGRGPRFQPPAAGPVLGPCRPGLGPRIGAHVEVFAANRVVVVAAGIGTRPPVHTNEGRITGARCFGALVTLEPTGVVLTRPDARLSLADLFRSWGQPLSTRQLAGFKAGPGQTVSVFVGGRPVSGPPGRVPLGPHAEIVLEVGPYVPPHARYHFPPGA